MTERLYRDDPYRTTFESKVVRRFPEGEKIGIVLEETCFYPASGGQHCDLGTLGGVAVEDVRQEGGEIVHVLASDPGGDRLAGTLDWARRYDHMQQHSGQHVLSQSFLRVLGLETLSAHLGTDVSTVELPAEKVTRADLDRVEREANRVVFECRPIRAAWMSPDEAVGRGIRKVPEREGRLRVVEVKEYDLSACGGTHCRSTGEVGLIKIGRTERIRRRTRVEFLCGGRALRDYQNRWRWLEDAALLVGRHSRDLSGEVRRLIDEVSRRTKDVARLEKDLLGYRAREILETAVPVGGVRKILWASEDMTPEGLAALAGHLVAQPGVVALLGLRAEKGHLVAARSEDIPVDMGRVLRESLSRSGGRGGGKPAFARGGVDADRLDAALEDLGRTVEEVLSDGA